MYGAILGDIIGSRYEWRPVKDKSFPLFGSQCSFTDDTVMTIAVADGFEFFMRDYYPNLYKTRNKNGRIKASDIEEDKIPLLTGSLIKNMCFWGKKYPNAGYGGRFRRWLLYNPKPYNSWGNGSAMRVASVGWMFEDIETTRKMAAVQSAVSHDHPEGIKGAEAAASAIYLARSGNSKEDIRNYISEEFGYDLNRTCEEIRPDYKFDVSCQGSVPESIIAFLDAVDFEDAIRNAISLGGDSDTMGAIAGSIAEAYFGVPKELKQEAESRIPDLMKKTLAEFREKWM